MSLRNTVLCICISTLLFLFISPALALTNLIGNGDLDTYEPFFWHAVGSGCSWATDEVYQGIRSIKIEKSSTGDEAGWMTENFSQRYWNGMASGSLYHIGGVIKTEGVNTNPTDDTYKIGLMWGFYTGGTLISEEFIPVDQSVASKDWETIEAYVAMPDTPDSAYCYFKFGENATGTAWGDGFILSSDPWTAGFFGDNCETPAGWMEWHSEGDVGLAEYTDEEAHSGTYSAKLMDLDTLPDEIVFYSIPWPCDPDTLYLVSAWLKTLEVNTDPHYLPSNVTPVNDGQRLGMCFFYHMAPLYTAWNLTGGDQFFYANQVDSSEDWRKYEVVSRAPSDAAGVSVRARFNPFPTGTVYYDDFSVEKIALGSNIIENGDFETYEPFFWHAVGSGCSWATDEVYQGIRSIKIEKSSKGDEAGWMTENFSQRYWNGMQSGSLYHIGGVIKTEGVNTDPTDDTYKIGLMWGFYTGGTLISEEFIPVDQSVASKDWETIEAYVAMPDTPDSAYCYFKFGENATGTAWGDGFILSSDPWTAGFFGDNCETPAGWMEWHSEGDVGLAEYTDEEAHSGTYSAKLMDLDTLPDEIVFYSIPYPCEPDTLYYLSVWLKTVEVNTDPHYLPSNVTPVNDGQRLGVCFFFHMAPLYTAWNLTGGDQFFYANQVDSSADWTKYEVVARAPSDAAGVSVRARFNPFPTGTVYYDDFEVRKVTKIPVGIEEDHEGEIASTRLLQNYPNPFVYETNIRYEIPKDTYVNMKVYDILGREIVTLVDGRHLAGIYNIKWDGRTNTGEFVPNGIYFYRLATDDFETTQKLVIMK